ncbi:MAG: PHB depolymerase family esterase [Sandaracinaceae bacterium]
MRSTSTGVAREMSEKRISRAALMLVWLAGCGPQQSPPVETEPTTAPEPTSEAEAPPQATAAGENAPSEAEVTAGLREARQAMLDGRVPADVGPEGWLGTWRLSGRTWVSNRPRMELSEAASGAPEVTLHATILAPHDTHAWLLVGMRGAAEVRLDGNPVAEGESAERLRVDRVFARLPLERGEHELAIVFRRPERGAWRGQVRWIGADGLPGLGHAGVALPAMDAAALAERAASSVRFETRSTLDESTPTLCVSGTRPAGGVDVLAPVTVGEVSAELGPRDRAEHCEAMPARGSMDVVATREGSEARFGGRIASDRTALASAAALLGMVDEAPESARAPIAWRGHELLRAVREGDGDARWRRWLDGERRRIRRALDREQDPFGALRGYQRMAFFSRLDGTAQMYELFVPPGHRASRPLPLLITLHGYEGNAGDYFRNTFGLARDYEGRESLQAHGRHGEAPTRGPMIVIAPTGRGQSFYRHAGEIDVLEAIADVRSRTTVDPRRIYITGGSMGGTGAAYLPFRHPDLFAASAALAGYHDQRVRVDTDHAALSDVEHFMEAHRSDIDWTENALHLPMLLIRGTRDRPLAWTRRLVERMDALNYRHEHREPELGHNVWTEAYAEGAIFRYLGRYRRPESPRHVRLRTARERTLAAYWVRVEQRAAADTFAEIDARYDDGTIEASIDGAAAVTFSPPEALHEAGAPLIVQVGESTVEGPAPLTLEAFDGGWRRATQAWPEPGARSESVSGPIRDVFHEPLTFVVGTQDPAHTFANRLVAEHWSSPHGWIADYPIVDDVDVTDAMIQERTLVLIGPPWSNAVHARLEDLPLTVERDGMHLGGAVHEGEQVGAAFVARSSLAPDRSVLVIAGVNPIGTLRSRELPDILPDYVVYDETVTHSRDRWACGGTGCVYRAHGFFDMHMRLPE